MRFVDDFCSNSFDSIITNDSIDNCWLIVD